MESITNTQIAVDHRVGQLKAILYLLQTHTDEFRDEVERSYELLKIGEKTPLSKTIEDTMNNPLTSILDVSSNINDKVKNMIDQIVQSFLRLNAAHIRNAYRTKTSMNDLHYSIVLNMDNMDNRNKLFAFLDDFDLLDISSKYPVYFQFVPAELADKIPVGEVLHLEKSK